jgi:4'-phosphopantetheinyl transferase EntD
VPDHAKRERLQERDRALPTTATRDRSAGCVCAGAARSFILMQPMKPKPPEDLGALRGPLESLAPVGLALELGSGFCSEALLTDEAHAIRDWTPQRRAQFATGRSRARHAFARLGAPLVAIPFDDEGAPIWPAGVVGSISHKREHCIAAVARTTVFENVGVDLEFDVDDRAESELVRRVCVTATERAQAVALRDEMRSPGTFFLAAKEAYFKFQFPMTRTRLDWDEVEVTLLHDHSFHVMRIGDPSSLVSGVRLVALGWIVALVTKTAASPVGCRNQRADV